MALVWLDDSTYPSVRAAIATDLTAATLPDAVIALPIYGAVAELAVKDLDTNWAVDNDDDDKFAILQLAAIYWCASLILPTQPFMTSETFGQRDYQYQADSLTPTQLLAILRARASALVGLVTGGTLDTRPFFFGVAHGYRSMVPSELLVPVLPPGSILLGVG
jgi:hypothetical protein